ncbi:MAG TPA: cysteine desulfurase [Clostridia bacterium]|jgi:cysteine desulfurase|nr:cysteine desulfurase [Clostridia bacterium]
MREEASLAEIYLDNSATTKIIPQAAEAMAEAGSLVYGNPSSLHGKGLEAEKLLKGTREILAENLSCTPEEIFFTSGGTESNNWAILGCLHRRRRRGKHIISTKIEHPSVLKVCQYLEEEGYQVTYLGTDSTGIIDLEELKETLREDTVLVSVMYVNNETGAIQPVEEIGRFLKEARRDIVFHVDAVQAFGKIPLNPAKAGIDLLSLSAHKIHGPKGVGALFISKGVAVDPLLRGGEQENGMRPGTENVPGIAAFGAAVKFIPKWLEESSRVYSLKEQLIKLLRQRVPEMVVNGSPDRAIPYIVNLSFPGIKGEVLVHYLEQYGIYVSTGSACHSRSGGSSHVLTALGLDKERLEGAIRVSFSYFNRPEEIEQAAGKIADAVIDLQSLR